MVLNAKKCAHVKFSRKHKIVNSKYFIGNVPINEVDTVRDLGVVFDHKLTFVPHIENVIKRSSRMLGFVIRNTKTFRRSKTKILLYNSYVRSMTEYCSVVWRPHYSTHSLRIERVQKRFLQHLSFSAGIAKKKASYNKRLKHFGIESLELRRRLADAIFLYKLVRNKIDCPQLLDQFYFRAPSRMPRKPITPLCPPLRRTVFGSNSPIPRLCKILNACCRETDIHFDPIVRFKRTVRDCLSGLV